MHRAFPQVPSDMVLENRLKQDDHDVAEQRKYHGKKTRWSHPSASIAREVFGKILNDAPVIRVISLFDF